jgi:DNA-binding NarL/FixJ family response regulator
VSVWVPAGHAPSPQRRSPAERAGNGAVPPRTRSGTGKIRVLLVDDHAVVREGIALQLVGQSDIEVVGEAADSTEAVEMVRTLHPDVITMDVNMPGMNGIEAARLIHAEHPATRIIGLSMSEESEQGAAMKNAGAVSYLSKSASLDRLLAAIRESAEGESSASE